MNEYEKDPTLIWHWPMDHCLAAGDDTEEPEAILEKVVRFVRSKRWGKLWVNEDRGIFFVDMSALSLRQVTAVVRFCERNGWEVGDA